MLYFTFSMLRMARPNRKISTTDNVFCVSAQADTLAGINGSRPPSSFTRTVQAAVRPPRSLGPRRCRRALTRWRRRGAAPPTVHRSYAPPPVPATARLHPRLSRRGQTRAGCQRADRARALPESCMRDHAIRNRLGRLRGKAVADTVQIGLSPPARDLRRTKIYLAFHALKINDSFTVVRTR